MAVHDTIPGLEVEVRVDGQPLREYEYDEEDHVSEPNTVCKYVESVSDKQYTITLKVGAPFELDSPTLIMRIYIDGQYMDGKVVSKVRSAQQLSGNRFLYPVILTSSGKYLDGGLLQNYKFAKIETSTDDQHLVSLSKDSKDIAKVGEIIVKLWRATPEVPSRKSNFTSEERTNQSAVHEKALKGQAKSHLTALAPAIRTIPQTTVSVVELDGVDNPLAIFNLRYRSKESLKSLLVIERTPTPEPQHRETPEIENLTAEQRRELDRFLRGLVNNRNRCSSQTPERGVKREREAQVKAEGSRKKRRSGEQITIDLTGDSDSDSDDGIVVLN